jgi:MFS family permease
MPEGTVVRAWVVWTAGILAYIVAVLDRTTLGVSGLEAADRFGASPEVLSTFVALQVIVYAAAQIPAGLLLDRFGSRLMIVTGGCLMVIGQLTMAYTTSLSTAIAIRALIGLGDAFTFISVLRLVPNWFKPQRVPLIAQITGISGQLGQVLSALPFLQLLTNGGWSTAYSLVAAFGLVSVVAALALIKNSPGLIKNSPGTGPVRVDQRQITLRETLRSVKDVWLRPGTRLGFFTHMGTQFSVTVFALMWGVPYLTAAQNLSRDEAGNLLTLSVTSAIVSGIIIGILTGRRPHRRSRLVLGIIIANATAWTVILSFSSPAPPWLLAALIIVISVGGPGSMVGFDFARTFNPQATLGTAQGVVNMGGFLASLLVMLAMGMVIGATGGYSFESFQLAWTVQYLVWAGAIAGILVTRRKARRTIGDIEESRHLLEFFTDVEPVASKTRATPPVACRRAQRLPSRADARNA